MACRFVLGVGVGGKYPLAATIRAEACTDGEVSRHSATEVAKGFFWQTCATTHHIRLQPASHTVAAPITYGCRPGAMLPYVVGLLLVLYLTPGRLGLGLG